jgi:hypothetical protein
LILRFQTFLLREDKDRFPSFCIRLDMKRRMEEHSFSIEMKSRNSLSHISLSDRSSEPVLIQGELGGLEEVYLQEGVTLEVRGGKGTLRLDISREELGRFLAHGNHSEARDR